MELKKLMSGLAEKAKISIRNIRREANDNLKKNLKDKKISEDELKNYEKKIQNSTDNQVSSDAVLFLREPIQQSNQLLHELSQLHRRGLWSQRSKLFVQGCIVLSQFTAG